MGCGTKRIATGVATMGLSEVARGIKDGTKVSAPADRSYNNEYAKTLNTQIAYAPELYAAEAKYQPMYAQLRQDIAQQQLPGIMDMSNQMAGPVYQQLNQQAMSDLQYGGALTPDQQRQIEQQTRAAFTARGMGRSNPAVTSEVMNLQGAQQARLRDRQQFAMGVDGMRQQSLGGIMQLVNGYGQKQFDPESSYAQDVYNTNYNGNAAAKIATANNRAAMVGGLMGAGGQVGGAGVMALMG